MTRKSWFVSNARVVFVCALLCVFSCGVAFRAGGLAGSDRLSRGADEVKISNSSRSAQNNRPISIARPFVQGEIKNFAQATIGGVALPTQCDVKNRWPDGSLKFAIVSFVVPSIPGKGSVIVTFSNQIASVAEEPLGKAEMLDAAYNFDGQIQLTGTASHRISARAILTAADACHDPGNDIDSGHFLCTYWLKGPIVTAVLIEDRTSERKFDVNVDGETGNPLHPIFEAWFYPQTKAVQLGYTLEDDWASVTPTKSARDQKYSVVLTGGESNPVNEYSNGTFLHITRTRWHKTFWLNQAEAGAISVDNNWSYLANTKFLPHWDPDLKIAGSLIETKVKTFQGSSRVLEGCTNCYGGDGGIGNFQMALNAGGAADWHGPLTTWDIIYLMSQNPNMLAVALGNADLAGRIPYFYREADVDAGRGKHFDGPSGEGSVQTHGRVISVNARTQISMEDATTQDCNTNYAADWVNFGGKGQDTQNWNLDTSHWPNLAYASYLATGQYAYYEEQLMQSAYAIGDSPGTRACTQGDMGSLRQGPLGYWYVDQERGTDWMARENAIGAFIAADGSPEQTYFKDKLFANLAVWEGCHNIKNDIPGNHGAAWTYGNEVRGKNYPLCRGTALGSWTEGLGGEGGYQTNARLNQSGPNAPKAANANFQNAYSSLVIGWIDDFGFCPHLNGNCQMLAFVANRYINIAMNPAANIHNLADYVYPTLDGNGKPITSWAANQSLYASQPNGWPVCGNVNPDESYPAESAAAMSYFYRMTSSQGNYSGEEAYTKVRKGMGCINNAPNFDFASGSPKWDITPR